MATGAIESCGDTNFHRETATSHEATGDKVRLAYSSREAAADAGLLVLRAALAAVFVYHGGQKLFGLFGGYGLAGTAQWMGSIGIPLPYFSAIAAGSVEFFGGLALLFGLWPRLAAAPLIFTMLVAIVTTHWGKFDARAGGMEYPLTLAAALAAIALLGGGRFTIRRWLPWK